MTTSTSDFQMAAANSVFDTYELLENIIIRLPAIDITTVMRVATTWRDIISKSVRIHDARILAPIEKIRPHDDPREGHAKHPSYESTPGIDFTDLSIISPRSMFEFENSSIFLVDGKECVKKKGMVISIHEDTPKLRNLYATLPPSHAIYVKESMVGWDYHCGVYVKNGVRIGDLIDAHRAVKTFRAPVSLRRSRHSRRVKSAYTDMQKDRQLFPTGSRNLSWVNRHYQEIWPLRKLAATIGRALID
ncbi:hypothetical protein LTR37_021188 [Vermiconidia calcicola]|uniref:Uncharacterized protein n=1 Tax=Vermiconidia calcicola TaxID=1690605 RepID=A0ACC3MB28_9PEZI|nr:hypothetical protein LTR37_021188 [Vermiconidia calcicola]